jgi:hypothetical protein
MEFDHEAGNRYRWMMEYFSKLEQSVVSKVSCSKKDMGSTTDFRNCQL